jgi:hypothetical protein
MELRIRVNSYKGQVLAAKSWLTTILVYSFISLGVALAILAPAMLSATAINFFANNTNMLKYYTSYPLFEGIYKMR